VALNRFKRIENACPNDTCPAGYGLDAQRSSTYTLVRATDILLIGGGVVTASGLVWLFLSPSSKSPTAAAACTGTGCGAYLSGRF
jgi:hypothetical protein